MSSSNAEAFRTTKTSLMKHDNIPIWTAYSMHKSKIYCALTEQLRNISISRARVTWSTSDATNLRISTWIRSWCTAHIITRIHCAPPGSTAVQSWNIRLWVVLSIRCCPRSGLTRLPGRQIQMQLLSGINIARWRDGSSRQFWSLHIPSLSLCWTGCGILIDRENTGQHKNFGGQNHMDYGKATRVWVGPS